MFCITFFRTDNTLLLLLINITKFLFSYCRCRSAGNACDPVNHGVDFGHKHSFGFWITDVCQLVRVDEVAVVHPVQGEGIPDVTLNNVENG